MPGLSGLSGGGLVVALGRHPPAVVDEALGLVLPHVDLAGVLAAGLLVDHVTGLVDALLGLVGVAAEHFLDLVNDRHVIPRGCVCDAGSEPVRSPSGARTWDPYPF